MAILGDLTAGVFLRDFWQKKPLMIESAFPEFSSIEKNPLPPDRLTELAFREEVSSRIIIETKHAHKRNAWEVKYGPFTSRDFAQLPKVNWSLLVSDVDKHIPDIKQYLNQFRFIPDWRIDDLMISYAPPGSSVGAHVDEYDVFLLQVQGTRKWQIETQPGEKELIPNSELKILKNFNPDQEWVLEPGDMLYLPPGIPHHGIAQASKTYGYDCMTWSIGFRAPSYQELVTGYADAIAEQLPQLRYMDPQLRLQDNPAEITDETIDHIFDIIEMNLSIDKTEVAHWFGRYITEAQHAIDITSPVEPVHVEQLQTMLGQHYALLLNPAIRCVFIRIDQQNSYLFINGERYPARTAFAELFCQKHYITPAIFDQFKQDVLTIDLIATLYNSGYLITRNTE